MNPSTDNSEPASVPSSPAPRPGVITHADEGVRIRAFGNEINFQLTSEQSGNVMVVGLATVPPGSRVPPHVQSREDELFLVLEGEYRFWLNGEWKEARQGTLVYVPRGVPHTFEVTGERTGKHWVLSAPAGFDRFFAKYAEVCATPGPPDVARLAAINAEFGIKLV